LDLFCHFSVFRIPGGPVFSVFGGSVFGIRGPKKGVQKTRKRVDFVKKGDSLDKPTFTS